MNLSALKYASIFIFLVFWFQIQNADDVLITPLEKFRKEQIGAAKVRDHLHKPIFYLFHTFLSKLSVERNDIRRNSAECCLKAIWLYSQYVVEARVDYKEQCGLIATSNTFIPGQS